MYRGSAYSIQSDKDNIFDQSNNPIEKSFQIALVGDIQVGKSSILSQFVDNMFNPQIQNTKGIDMRFKKIMINNYLIKLRVWDTSGQDILKSIKEGYLKNIDAIMLIFDLTDQHSFENLINWNIQINKYYQENNSTISKVLMGNKSDLMQKSELSMLAKVIKNLQRNMDKKTKSCIFKPLPKLII